MQALCRFRYDSMIPNGLMRIFSGAPCVIRGVLGEIGLIWPRAQMHDGDVKLRRLGPDHVRQAVAESSEDSVERQFGSAVVAIEIAMMQVVGVGARGEFAIQDGTLETVVGACRLQRRKLGVEEEVDGVRGHHTMNQQHAEIDDVFDRMHRHTGPRARVDVLVV